MRSTGRAAGTLPPGGVSLRSLLWSSTAAAAQNLGREAPGATSALLGCTQFLIGAAVSPLVGVLGATTVFPMAAIMAACLVLALLTAVVVAH